MGTLEDAILDKHHELKSILPDIVRDLEKEEKKWYGMEAEVREDGLCYFQDGTIIDLSTEKCN